MRGWRLLGAFWAALGLATVACGLVLAALGPPRGRRAPDTMGHRPTAVASIASPHAASPRTAAPSSDAGAAAIARPDPAMLEADPDAPGRSLPRPGPDGSRPSVVYAAAVARVLPGQARLALVIDGFGLDRRESLVAAALFPPSVTFAISPYGTGLADVAAGAHARGHETLASLPMEPEDSPLADEGDRALDAAADPADNARNLDWSLSATTAYVGATGADASGDGERFSAATGLFRNLVVGALEKRGLLYVSPGPIPPDWPRTVPVVEADVVLPAVPTTASLDAALASLADTALRRGHALGIVGPPIPALTDHVLAFLRTLPARGIVLVPASALAGPEPAPDADPSLASLAAVPAAGNGAAP